MPRIICKNLSPGFEFHTKARNPILVEREGGVSPLMTATAHIITVHIFLGPPRNKKGFVYCVPAKGKHLDI